MTTETNTHTASFSARMLLRTCILCIVLLPLAALGARFGLWSYKLGLPLFAGSLLVLVLLLTASAGLLLLKPASHNRATLQRAALLALVPIAVVAFSLSQANSDTMIHDISTDLINPPEFVVGVKKRGDDSNPLLRNSETDKQQLAAYPDITPLHSPLDPAAAYHRALPSARNLGWDIYAQAPLRGRIEAVDTTLWFGFKDDIVIRIQPRQDGSIIDLRSVSRVGKSDLGANAKRIRDFMAEFSKDLPST